MTAELREKIIDFRVAMSVVKSMLKIGVITSEDYAVLEGEIAKTYGLSLDTIFK